MENGIIRVVDMGSVIQALEGNGKAINEFGREDFDIHQFLRDYCLQPEGYALPLGRRMPISSHASEDEQTTKKRELRADSREQALSKSTLNSLSHTSASHTIKDQLMKRYRQSMPPAAQMDTAQEFGSRELPRTIREHLKGAFGMPLMPGSSVKGSIRTAILACLINKDRSNVAAKLPQSSKTPAKRAAQDIVGSYFGRDPKLDVFRCIHVGDAAFSPEDVYCKDVRWFNLRSPEEGGWRDIQSRATQSHWNVTGVHVEALEIGSRCTVNIQWDDFLLNSPKVADTQHFGGVAALFASEDNLASTINSHSLSVVKSEKSFFDRFELRALSRYYEYLETNIEKLPPRAFILRLSWGSGWKGMTGDWLEKTELKQIRELYRKHYPMGKSVKEVVNCCPKCSRMASPDTRKPDYGYCHKCSLSFPAKITVKMFEVFPKTRRVVFERGEPSYPMGWVKLSPMP
jgi:CRISPR/Cas system CSM-associated protein Csm5 (group 7 of RAMP superfamily)